jgi:hypothetical protein
MIAEYYYGPRPAREVRAVYDAWTIRVYQAFEASVALPALEAQTFVPPFKFVISWASWIKPSFLWIMTRTAWGTQTRIGNKGRPEHKGNAFVLGIDVQRDFFDHILRIARSTHYPEGYDKGEWKIRMREAQAYIQWDPEKDLNGQRREWKAIQVGLKTPVLKKYAESIVRISDMRDLISEIVETSTIEEKIKLLPDEVAYDKVDSKVIEEKSI